MVHVCTEAHSRPLVLARPYPLEINAAGNHQPHASCGTFVRCSLLVRRLDTTLQQPQIARPLRLDRPDSFGRWFIVATLTVPAGISLMTYQLRRYRNDDFVGTTGYAVVILVSALASVNACITG